MKITDKVNEIIVKTNANTNGTNISNAPLKATPADADAFCLLDSANGLVLKKSLWGNLKTTLGSLFAPLSSPALTGTPTAPTATAGTNTTQIATTAFVKAKSEADSIGIGQTYQNVTASRIPNGTNYNNGTSKPIKVMFQCSLTSGNGMYIATDGGIVARISGDSANIQYNTMTAIIPPGGNYSVSFFAGSTATNIVWFELR